MFQSSAKKKYRFESKQSKPNQTQTRHNVEQCATSYSDFVIHSISYTFQTKSFCASKRDFKRFTMEKSKEVTSISVGCVICSSNFSDQDEQTIMTSCGHLYHNNCLAKWFESVQE